MATTVQLYMLAPLDRGASLKVCEDIDFRTPVIRYVWGDYKGRLQIRTGVLRYAGAMDMLRSLETLGPL